MFTGITRACCEVIQILREKDFLQYEVMLTLALVEGLQVGASIAIDGVCQTVTQVSGVQVSFQAIKETLSRTTLSDLYIGRKVNIERSARLGDEMGGHEISGHVFETGSII